MLFFKRGYTLFILLYLLVIAYPATANINLTTEEQIWIENNTVKIGVESWSPVIYEKNNKAQGLAGDFLNLVIAKTGLKTQIITDSWDSLLIQFKNHQLNLLPATYFTDARTEYGEYSSPYFNLRTQTYALKTNNHIKSLQDLQGKKLAIQKGNGTIDKIKKLYPNIQIIETSSMKQAIQFVLTAQADAMFDSQLSIEYFLQQQAISSLKGIPDFSIDSEKLHFFTQKYQPVLNSILQKGLDSITKTERNRILRKWLNHDNIFDLTDKEQAWLDKKIPIRYVYDPDWAPFEWTNGVNNHTGILADILHLVKMKSGLQFIPIHAETWQQAIDFAKNRTADMYSGVGNTAERREYMNFPPTPIFTTNYVFISRQGEDYANGFAAIQGKKIAVVDGYTIHGIMKEHKPNISLTLLKATTDGFTQLLSNEIDVFLVNAATAKYFLKDPQYETLTESYETKFQLNLNIAIRNDWPDEVLSIIDKSLKSISKKDLFEIYEKWTEVTVVEKINYTLVIQIVIGFFILMLIGLYWTQKQAKLIAQLDKQRKNIQDSINYAALIQYAILPTDETIEDYFSDSFVHWQPKNTVGGDIFFITELASKDEVLIMIIDGAGHGVPGAFVTMLVKAIETQIIADIAYGKLDPSPAKILAYFNYSIKTMLKQEKGSRSNAGFDGGILYYNRATNSCKYAGAKTPLYIINDNQLEIIKSDRKNVGYIRTKIDQQYTEYDIEIKADTRLYLCTDGIIDQEGENDSTYGKKRFENIILKNHRLSFKRQKQHITDDFNHFITDAKQQTIEQRDDITIMGLKF